MCIRKLELCRVYDHMNESGLAWLLGRVCTYSTFKKIGLFTSHQVKQPNLSGSSLSASFIPTHVLKNIFRKTSPDVFLKWTSQNKREKENRWKLFTMRAEIVKLVKVNFYEKKKKAFLALDVVWRVWSSDAKTFLFAKTRKYFLSNVKYQYFVGFLFLEQLCSIIFLW